MNKRQYKKYVKKLHEQGRLTQEERKMQNELLQMIFASDTEIGKILRNLNQYLFFQ